MTCSIQNSRLRACALIGFAAMQLAGCAGSSDKYPSLAIRDAERQVGTLQTVTPQPPVAPIASATDLSAIVERARATHEAFREAEPGIRELAQAASGLGVESNEFSRATAGIATLSSLRGQTVAALGSLDELETEAATNFAPLAEIRAAQSEIEGMVREQSAALEVLSAGQTR